MITTEQFNALVDRVTSTERRLSALDGDVAELPTPTPTAEELAGGFRWITDPTTGNRTQQFGYAPTGTNADGSTINTVANTTPDVPATMQIGARVRAPAFDSQAILIVEKVTGGVVSLSREDDPYRAIAHAIVHDAVASQVELVTPAPTAEPASPE